MRKISINRGQTWMDIRTGRFGVIVANNGSTETTSKADHPVHSFPSQRTIAL
jgi:hypothetical protein